MNARPAVATMLAIDDDEAMLRLIRAACRAAHGDALVVETESDPAAALARIERGGVDVVLTDLEMPGIDGLAVLHAAKRREATTQVVLLTGRSTHEALLAALEAGAADYALKPVDGRQIASLVGQAIERWARWRRALGDSWRMQAAVPAAIVK